MPPAAVLAQEIDLVLSPDGPIYLNDTNRGRGHFDLVLHNLGIVSRSGPSVEVTRLSIEALRGEQVLLTKWVAVERLVQDTGRASEAPLAIFTAFQFLQAEGLAGLWGEASPSLSGTLEPGHGLITSAHHLSLDSEADGLRLTAWHRTSEGEGSTTLRVAVERYDSSIDYRLPVDGAWFMRALPGIESHHRLNAGTEFAVDLFKVDERGRTYVGDRVDATNYLGWGAAVRAAADGTVVAVEESATQDRTFFLPRDGETPQERGQRMQKAMMAAFQENPRRAAAGNLVTIRHQVGDHVEFSSYGHLEAGSVAVKVGQKVTAGDVLGRVGDTGDSPEVHLHFQVNAGQDPFLSKSLPFSFSDLKHAVMPPEPGLIVRSGQ